MPRLEDVYRQYPPYEGISMFEDEARALQRQLYIGLMLSTISSRSFMASIRKQITESIPCRVSLKSFGMFGKHVGNEKGYDLFSVFTMIITPDYEEVLNDQQIDEVIKKHFNIADVYTQEENPSRFFIGYSGLVIRHY